jgi:hypothetical protein
MKILGLSIVLTVVAYGCALMWARNELDKMGWAFRC